MRLYRTRRLTEFQSILAEVQLLACMWTKFICFAKF